VQNEAVSSLGIPDAVLALARRVAHEVSIKAAALGGLLRVDADEMIAGRAALLGIAPSGLISAGGATRLLPAADGWCALTLSRGDDIETVPALLELPEQPADVWTALAAAAADRDATDFVARARMLELPAAVLGEISAAPARFAAGGPPTSRTLPDLLVVDMSSMWAGPLCGKLLAAAGATVVKVESPTRPDGTRCGDQAFFDWINAAKLSYATDFRDDDMRSLLEAADVVIEGSRPAALIRRGLGPAQIPGRPGRVWLRVTGYGTDGDKANRVAFGDDAAVAGGLVGAGPSFVGDAIADPLTGLAATEAVLDALRRGGGEIAEVALAEVAANYACMECSVSEDIVPLRVPELPQQHAAELGADNARVRSIVEARLAPC
jgi:CoA transferase family III